MTLSALVPLVATLLHAEPQLGSPLRFGGYSIRPPLGFRMAPMEAFQQTRAGAIGLPGDSRELAAALVDGPGDDAAAMLVALADGPFSATPGDRDDFAAATVRHFAEELGMTLSLERADLLTGASARRVEVLGSLRHEGQVRRVLVAAMEGDPRHAVILFSLPSGRYEAVRDALRASLRSVRAEGTAPAGLSRGVSGAAAGALAGALLVSLALWRRNRKARRS